jgi:hypothetical protein
VLFHPVALSFETRLMCPSGDVHAAVPTGTGDFRGEFRVALSKALTQVPIYFDLEVGYMFRGSTSIFDPHQTPNPDSPYNAEIHYAQEVAVHGEVGGTILRWKNVDRLVLTGYVDYRTSVKRPEASDFFTLVPDATESTIVGGVLSYQFWRMLGIMGRVSGVVEGRLFPRAVTGGGALFANY